MRIPIKMLLMSLSLIGSTSSAAAEDPESKTFRKDQKPPQFVVVSFDATPMGKKFEDWALVKAAKQVRAAAPEKYPYSPVSFTIFYNTAPLQLAFWWRPNWRQKVDETTRKLHLPSHRKFQASAIKHAVDVPGIYRSAQFLRRIREMGIELGSHGVNHDRGRKWSYERWQEEFAEFKRVSDMHKLPAPIGFRGAFLDITRHTAQPKTTDAPYRVMKEYGLRYDSSRVYDTKMRWPHRVGDWDLWVMPVPSAYFHHSKIYKLLFGSYDMYSDYSFYNALVRLFRQRYTANRAPLYIGGHGEHIRSIIKFMKTVCYLKDVRCINHATLADFMDRNPHFNNQAELPNSKLVRAVPFQNHRWLRALVRENASWHQRLLERSGAQ